MAKLVKEWINEKLERYLEETYKVRPGELYSYSYLQNVRWLLYSLKEIFKALSVDYSRPSKLDIRVRNGIKEELISLISMPDIGRARARSL